MLFLHAALLDNEILLWAEVAGTKGSTHAQFASCDVLAASLREVEGVALDLARGARSVVAWLPSVGNRAIPSSELIASYDTTLDAPDALAAHTVEALSIRGASFLALVRACADRSILVSGVAIGNDVVFWVNLVRFASKLVAERRYLPSLETMRVGRRTTYRAVWRPRLDAARNAELEAFALKMPSACRALARNGNIMPDTSPRDVARRSVGIFVDQLVRSIDTVPRMAGGSSRTAHDAWMQALLSENGEFEIGGAEARTFATMVNDWVRETTRDDDAEHRLCLRLEEPRAEGGRWFIRYLLQSHTDPSLLVDLESAWKNPRLRQTFLETIGKAARFSAPIEASLREKQPTGYELDDAGAHAFLTAEAALLSGAGCGILFPSWWTPSGAKAKFAVRAHAKRKAVASSGTGLDLNTIVSVDWTVALGGTPFAAKELAELARLKAPLVNVRGQWVMVDGQQIRAAIDLLGAKNSRTMRLGDLATMALTGRGPDALLATEGVTGTGAIGTLLDRLSGRANYEEQTVPASLRGTLRPYQVRGYSWLHFLSRLGLGACLADDMGLGKSITTLALIARDWDEDPSAPVLLVSPTSVIGNWQREIARFAPQLPVVVHHGGERTRSGALLPRKARVAVVLTSYGVLQRDRDLLKNVPWRGIVLDEAQNVKNAENKQSQAARALRAGYRVALTGTPIENHVGDLWSLMDFLNAGLLGDAASFRREFHIPITAYGDEEAEARLKRMTAPFVLRRLKSDPTIIADLPKKLEMRTYCQLTKEQASLYAAVLHDVEQQLNEAEGMTRRGLILATLMKLKQVCNHPAHLLRDNSTLRGRSGKLARLAEMLEEVRASGEHALVFTQFTEMAELLQRYLQESTGREALYLHGGLSKGVRDAMVERFQTAKDTPAVFILSLRAGGTGLNLTRANHVFHFDRWWNPAVENQASDRAYRIGQTKNVHVHRLICAGTVEEKIDAMLERKGALANRLVKSGEAGLTELSNTQLHELFALGADAVIDV